MLDIIELKSDINQIANKIKLNSNKDMSDYEMSDYEIKITISKYLTDKYVHQRKIYEYLVKSEYPNVEIYIREYKGADIIYFTLLRFERIKKLKKLETLSKTLYNI